MRNSDLENLSLIYEVNLAAKGPLTIAINDILSDKNVESPEIVQWFRTKFIKWYLSPEGDENKTGSFQDYQAKEGDPDWMRRPDIKEFVGFTDQQKQEINHMIDFLVNIGQEYVRSLDKKTVANVVADITAADRQAAANAGKALSRDTVAVKSVEGTHYKLIKRYEYTYSGQKMALNAVLLTSNYAFREESCFLGHCVGRGEGENKVPFDKIGDPNDPSKGPQSFYFKEYQQGKMLIISFRRPDNNKPAVTLEVGLSKPQRPESINDDVLRKILPTSTIKQIKGFGNAIPEARYQQPVRDFIKEYNIPISGDGENIGFVKWGDKYYDQDSEAFKEIEQKEIIPAQQKIEQEIKKNLKQVDMKYLEDLINKLKIDPNAPKGIREKIMAAFKERLALIAQKNSQSSASNTVEDSYRFINTYLKVLEEGFRYGKV
jgi:hypothetical protein